MKRGAESFRRPPRRQHEVPHMADVLEQLDRSGCIYFVKTLTKTAIQTRIEKTAMLSLPAQFVRENGDKIEQWVIFRTHLSPKRSGRPWAVRLSASESGKVVFCGGFKAFVIGNRLRTGDSLIFVLQEDIRSEFEVYTFRGSEGVPLYPDDSDSTCSGEENNSRSSFPSPSHHQNERKKPFTRDTREGEATPSPYASHFDCRRVHKKAPTSDTRERRTTPPRSASHVDYHRVHCKNEPTSDKNEPMSNLREGRGKPSLFANQWQTLPVVPCFRKRLTASNIGRSDRDPRTNSGQFEIPERFVRTHAKQIYTPIKLQGIHEDSCIHVITCRPRPGTRLRVDLVVTGWSRFVKENRLEKGQWLQFSLMADSFFVVRKV